MRAGLGGAGGRPTIRRSVRAAAADDRDTSWIERLAPQRWVEAREAKEHEAAVRAVLNVPMALRASFYRTASIARAMSRATPTPTRTVTGC